MTAVPEPSDAIKALRMLTAAEIATRAAALTGHGKDLFIGTLISYADPIVRRAVLAALGGAEAGQGLTEEPRPAGPDETAPECRFCHHADVPLMRTTDGFQCLDGIDCYGRQDAGDTA